MNNEINIKNLSFKFEEETVLNGVDLAIEQGQFLVILGASGSGKSTLLRILSNILPSKKTDLLNGEISLFGQSPSEYLSSGKLSFMFQEASLMPNLTVRDNISLPRKLRGLPINNDHIQDLLNVVGLSKDQNKYPKELSGGMKTRVSLARAFVTKPELLLLDEPFSALDISWKYDLYKYLHELAARFKTTIVVVTHDIQEAVILGNKLVILSKSGYILNQLNLNKEKFKDFSFSGINNKIKSNLTTILDIQTKIMVDGIREDYSREEALEMVKQLILKEDLQKEISDYEIKEIQAVKKHILDADIFSNLISLWHKTQNRHLKNELMWRILDNKNASDEIHKEIKNFIYRDWDKYVKEVQKEQYFQQVKIIENTQERLINTEYPSTKDWLYITYMRAMAVGDINLECAVEDFVDNYKKTHDYKKFSKFFEPFQKSKKIKFEK
jgi:ABC-type nitrate/sulfonate/bicarbonate transport system ATPase subunit